MRELRELHLDHNRIAALPDAVGELRELRELDLRGNALERGARRRSARLARLRVLDLRANRLAALPDALGDLPALEKLDLRWNRFVDPPDWTERLRERGCVVLA